MNTFLEIDRRSFFKLAGGGIVVFFGLGSVASLSQDPKRFYPEDFNAYLVIGKSGKVTVFSSKIEMGQGVMTSQAQMVAEELGVPLSSIVMVLGDTDRCPVDMGTFGSLTTRMFGPALRAAAAQARAALMVLGARNLGVPRDNLIAKDGIISIIGKPNRSVSYGELSKGAKIIQMVDHKAVVRKASEFQVMGASPQRLDGLEKVTGASKYAADIRVPGMLYARILRPTMHGATLVKLDTSGATNLPGITLVNRGDLIAVLHADPEAAEIAFRRIKADWRAPDTKVGPESIYDHLVLHAAPLKTLMDRGDITAARADAVHVFGGKSASGQAIEAARLAQITGKPVQVAWTRSEEFFNDTFDPASVVKIVSGIDRDGRISLWDCSVYSAGDRGAIACYAIPNARFRSTGGSSYGPSASQASLHPFAVGPWRGPGANMNVFAIESQIDIMAATTKQDPLAFRLYNMADLRMRRVLQAAADAFGWKAAVSPSRRGFGLACNIDAGTYVATIAEVKVDHATGRVKVVRVVCAQDMGVVVNPEGAKMQIEGGITMGLGYTLAEELRFLGGDILDRNFGTYNIPRFSWVPRIETVLVKNNDLAPQGGGEPPITTTGAVIANAVFDATGARMFRLPMTAGRIHQTIAKLDQR